MTLMVLGKYTFTFAGKLYCKNEPGIFSKVAIALMEKSTIHFYDQFSQIRRVFSQPEVKRQHIVCSL